MRIALAPLLAAALLLPAISACGPSPSVSWTAEGYLENTAVALTLDTPLPSRGSIIWCSTFQLAWDELKKLAGGDIVLEQGQETADLLNRARGAPTDLPEGGWYARAGFGRDGIRDVILREMAARFPGKTIVDLPRNPVALAYACLFTGVPFETPYEALKDGLSFRGSSGTETRVRGFGIPEGKAASDTERQRRQVRVLFHESDSSFALDLSQYSRSSQVILVHTERKGTLWETLSVIEEKRGKEKRSNLGEVDTLLVPNVRLAIAHRFREIEGSDKVFRNSQLQGLYLDTAFQAVDFTLDREGVRLDSQAFIHVASRAADLPETPRHFHFDRPFLIVLTKRGAERPYFALWVDGPEILSQIE